MHTREIQEGVSPLFFTIFCVELDGTFQKE